LPVGDMLPPLPHVGIAVVSYSGTADSLLVESVKDLMIRTLRTISPSLASGQGTAVRG